MNDTDLSRLRGRRTTADFGLTLADILRLQALANEIQDNEFGGCVPKLRIIEIQEIHDKFMRGQALETIASVMMSG
jgi:hypothetical protein